MIVILFSFMRYVCVKMTQLLANNDENNAIRLKYEYFFFGFPFTTVDYHNDMKRRYYHKNKIMYKAYSH